MNFQNNMSKRANLYTGRAGHLAVMAELLVRGWNTAIPEVDVGDDIFVVRDSDGNLHRVQVKTAMAKPLKSGYSAQFNISLSQLRASITLDLIYVFTVRLHSRWDAFVVIDQETLNAEHSLHGIGSEYKDRLTLRLRFTGASITCSGRDLSQYRDNWEEYFPIIDHR